MSSGHMGSARPRHATTPVVGLCAAIETASYGVWELEAELLPRSYAHAVQDAGGIALLLSPDDAVAERPDLLLDRIDALVLTGGGDIDPAAYGAPDSERVRGARPERDRFELALAWRALERDIPVLGICRGMQLLNVACGGTLHPHLPDLLGHERHLHTPGAFADHAVELDPGSLAARAAGETLLSVKSHHHQGVDELGEGVVVSGRSVDDGLPEAIELPDRAFALGVLWHTEEDEASRIIGSLVEQAAATAR